MAVQIQTQPLNLARVVALAVQYPGGQPYDRFQHHHVITTDAISEEFRLSNQAASGATNVSFAFPRYGLLFNGVERASYTRVGTERIGVFKGTLGNEADGEYIVEIAAYDASGARVADAPGGESHCRFGLWIDRHGQAKNSPNFIVQNGSFDWSHPQDAGRQPPAEFAWAIVPKALLAARAEPLTPRTAVPFNTALPSSKLTRINLTPSTDTDEMNDRRPVVTVRGITVCENRQPYTADDWIDPYPKLPHLDGERGVGTMEQATMLMPGRNGKWYGCDSFSLWRIDATGKKTTLAGLRHTEAPYWEDAIASKGASSKTEIVGKWDASIPVAERFPLECWGMCWDPRSLVLDPNAPLIGGQEPHLGLGPVAFLCDRHGFVLKLQFDGHNATAAPVVTRFFAANDPWAIAFVDGVLIVNERGLNRISKWNPDSGAFIGTLLANTTTGLGAVDPTTRRFVWAGSTYATVTSGAAARAMRKYQLVAPEGGAYLDGWWYYGMYALGEVRRVNNTTGEVQVVCRPDMGNYDDQAHFIYIAISDGTYGPRGTVLSSTNKIAYFGRPEAWLPTPGVAPDGTPLTNAVRWDWQQNAYDTISGAGGKTASQAYPMACAVGNGMLAVSTTSKGLDIFMQRDAAEVTPDYARMGRGAAYYRSKHYHLIHGQFGFGYTSLPLPWGENADLDYALAQWGHTPGATAPVDPPPVNPPPNDPPPTGPKTMFKSATKTATAGYAPMPTPGQRSEFVLHGSGGGNFTWGDTYAAVGDPTMGINDNMPIEFHAMNSGGYASTFQGPGGGAEPWVSIQPVDKVPAPLQPNMETNWAGYSHGSPKVANLYTHARLDALHAWSLVNLPIDPARMILTGNSMGGWGGVHYGLRRPTKFAALFLTLPRFRNTGLNDWDTGQAAVTSIPLPDGPPWVTFMDMVAYIANPANALPPLLWGTGKQEGFTQFQEHIDAVAALRATGRFFVFAWNNGNHSTATSNESMGRISASYDKSLFVLGKLIPVFTNSSLDTPFTADVGGINLGFKWRNATATTIEIANTVGAVEVDVTYAGATKHLSIAAGAWVTFDAGGVVTPPSAPTISNFLATPSSVAAGGSVSLNATVTNATAVTLDGAPVASLPVSVTPSDSHTYTLTASGPGGTISATVDVTVTAAPPPPTESQRLDALEAWARDLAQPVPFTGATGS